MESSHLKQSVLEKLARSDSDLETFEVSSDLSQITLVFSYQGIPESRIAILLTEVVHLNISRDIYDKGEFAFVIMEAVLSKLENGKEPVFSEIAYPFLPQNDKLEFPTNLYHLHIEGEIYADIIFHSFHILTPLI
ncbi:hypothetical protein [Beggiatoa leptomitoformis]|uniref:Uncharacterized protein n=1 Tax=Beggiatoa leptomitoformis TaxID=288004 RepID=A0A2N9YG65_9GAMM|nr:hypothetical protein [Beggiatoa leptomitoformis]ALG68208.1 hypothetical protein AL038_11420 [Beggiatoa leptomitoformis]AUI69487.1 hypothetical protein BLE401_12850 [Beggiatoa leptomitoformis]